jgi:hypothetical protein
MIFCLAAGEVLAGLAVEDDELDSYLQSSLCLTLVRFFVSVNFWKGIRRRGVHTMSNPVVLPPSGPGHRSVFYRCSSFGVIGG